MITLEVVMARSWTGVRPVESYDVDELYSLWNDAITEGGPGFELGTRPVSRERLAQVLGRSCVHAYASHQDGHLVGFLLATTNPLSPLTDSTTVTVEVLYVHPDYRNRGMARALLARAATLSEQTGATQVVSNVPSQARDLNRFFARLGFTATVTRRISTPASLRRRLAGEDVRPFDRVLARRRTQRARTGMTQPLEVLPAHTNVG
ncbi:GNAT family N-acetyltransferase [Arsenicicoccus dermatophilus]